MSDQTPYTDEPTLAAAIGVSRLFLKREDLHPYGSHKGRSIPLMIDMKAAEGANDFVISSSGNAALAALRHIQKRNNEHPKATDLSLSILIGEHIHPDKRQRLVSEIRDPRITVTESKRPLQALFELVKSAANGKRRESLRQSTDDSALVGYRTLAEELGRIPDLRAVFIPTSSGTTAQALAEYFTENKLPIAVHIVQTTDCHPLVDAVSGTIETNNDTERSLADAIVDKTAHRRGAIEEAVRKAGGTGWTVSNDDIHGAQKLLQENLSDGDVITANGALGLAGLVKALSKGVRPEGAIACIVTGK